MKCLKIDNNDRRMKFSALNADFSSPSSRRPAHVSVEEG